MSVVNGFEVADMVRHWLRTPPNGYHGSSYGSDPHSLLQQPLSTGLADAFLAKLLEDIPILGALPAGAVNVLFQDNDKESKLLMIEVLDSLITIDETGAVR